MTIAVTAVDMALFSNKIKVNIESLDDDKLYGQVFEVIRKKDTVGQVVSMLLEKNNKNSDLSNYPTLKVINVDGQNIKLTDTVKNSQTLYVSLSGQDVDNKLEELISFMGMRRNLSNG